MLNKILYHSDAAKTAGYIAFVFLFFLEMALTSAHFQNVAKLEFWQFALLGIASFRGGCAISEDGVFEWLRHPFVKAVKDSTGAGYSVEKCYQAGLLCAIGALLECPICTGTHVASMTLTIIALNPAFGLPLLYALGAAGLAELAHSAREYLFWHGRYARESCK